ILVVIFLATFIRSALGFGEALVAVPLLALLIPIETAAPLAVLVSITVAALILGQDWREVQMAGVSRLVLSTLPGIPVGLWLLIRVDEVVVKTILALVILLFSAYVLAGRAKLRLKGDRWAGAFGFMAGILGGAYGMNGPPLVLYGTFRDWSPEQFRATLQGYFLPASILGMIGYYLSGLWTREVTNLFLLTLPAVLIATLLGRSVTRRLPRERFVRWVHSALILIGLLLLGQGIWV
ncbi:MAG: sulfite exporter TauE/SafE family protein, partial [Vulcanimicrobiota bacterium]